MKIYANSHIISNKVQFSAQRKLMWLGEPPMYDLSQARLAAVLSVHKGENPVHLYWITNIEVGYVRATYTGAVIFLG